MRRVVSMKETKQVHSQQSDPPAHAQKTKQEIQRWYVSIFFRS
jgi:hypothetical protein